MENMYGRAVFESEVGWTCVYECSTVMTVLSSHSNPEETSIKC